MTTPQESLAGAQWVCKQIPGAEEVIYSIPNQHWHVRMRGSDQISDYIRTAVVLRNPSRLKQRVTSGAYETANRALILSLDRYVTYRREFLELDNAAYWMSGAAWVVAQAFDILAVAPDITGRRWCLRNSLGTYFVKDDVETRDISMLRNHLNLAQPRNVREDVAWYRRDFLEEWFVCEERGRKEDPVKTAPEAPSKPAVMTALPPDLQGSEKLRGLTLQGRRQAHVNAILQDMMTRKAPPRY